VVLAGSGIKNLWSEVRNVRDMYFQGNNNYLVTRVKESCGVLVWRIRSLKKRRVVSVAPLASQGGQERERCSFWTASVAFCSHDSGSNWRASSTGCPEEAIGTRL